MKDGPPRPEKALSTYRPMGSQLTIEEVRNRRVSVCRCCLCFLCSALADHRSSRPRACAPCMAVLPLSRQHILHLS